MKHGLLTIFPGKQFQKAYHAQMNASRRSSFIADILFIHNWFIYVNITVHLYFTIGDERNLMVSKEHQTGSTNKGQGMAWPGPSKPDFGLLGGLSPDTCSVERNMEGILCRFPCFPQKARKGWGTRRLKRTTSRRKHNDESTDQPGWALIRSRASRNQSS